MIRNNQEQADDFKAQLRSASDSNFATLVLEEDRSFVEWTTTDRFIHRQLLARILRKLAEPKAL